MVVVVVVGGVVIGTVFVAGTCVVVLPSEVKSGCSLAAAVAVVLSGRRKVESSVVVV